MEENRYADVILDIALEQLDRPFGYRIPERLAGGVEVGSAVTVPFGRGDTPRRGYVIAVRDICSFDPARTKDILALAEKSASAEERSVQIAAYLRKNYGGTFAQALKCVLPAKHTVQRRERKELVRTMDRESLIYLLGEAKRRHQTAKARLLEELLESERIPQELLASKLAVTGQTIAALERAGALRVERISEYRNPVKLTDAPGSRPQLSAQQERIVREIGAELESGTGGRYLIHGITGSGKTEVYMALIEGVVRRGQQAIFLIPEIALTYQTLRRFYQRFGGRVSVLSSALSAGEKYDQCERAKRGEIDIIIGPRSALFTPFPRLGLIVMDEEHENSYKSELTPKYHAREVAEELARMNGAGLVLGSATPSMEAYYKTRTGEYRLYELSERLTGGTLPAVSTVDLREELRSGNRSIFSRRLRDLLADRLERGEQSMLFLNRRGYSGFLSCRSCGAVIKCPHCDVTLSEHTGGRMVCHYCGYEERRPEGCPSCGSKYLAGFRVGTEQIEAKLRELFPGARTLRMDRDTTRTKDAYEKILSAFAGGEADILIGTQMIVKGHDFANVTLVGVLAADLSLGSGDFRAAERTFELLVQAAGRAGRGSLPGEAVIQTYQPEHYAVVRAAAQDYRGFYEEEIAYREISGYPPAGYLLAVQCFGRDAQRTGALAEALAETLRREQREAAHRAKTGEEPRSGEALFGAAAADQLRILGPAPGQISRIKDQYRFVLYLKAKERAVLVACKDLCERRIREMAPRNEFVQFDFDPVGML